jgi:hypothetical protein
MPSQRDRTAATAAKIFWRLPTSAKAAIVAILFAIALVAYFSSRSRNGAQQPAPPGSIVFMFWNVENLFDDHSDSRNSIDRPYDEWFAGDAAARKLKYDHLAEIILKVNGGKGPDIFAGVEVESLRAAELLRDALNAKLPAETAKYEQVAMKELTHNAGRYMAPCVISRIPLDATRTRLLGSNNLRILETHLSEKQSELWLVVSHWTSQRSDDGTRKGSGRDKYASTIYGEYQRIVKDNPDADVLVCGDFNTPPDSEAVTHELHMTGIRSEVVPARTDPNLFGLLSNKSPDRFGTHYYSKPLIYDQIGVSPGLLDDRGWKCDPDSVSVPTEGMLRDRSRSRRPWRFGDKAENPQGRGYSDHFPVVVNLGIQ